jgi:hypothetical protein
LYKYTWTAYNNGHAKGSGIIKVGEHPPVLGGTYEEVLFI